MERAPGLPLQRYLPSKRHIALLVLAVCCALLYLAPLAEASSSQTIAQDFQASSGSQIAAGALVSTKPGDSRSVELASTDTAKRLVGVVDKDPLLVISGSSTEVHVVLSGTTSVLVSDINGPIGASDKITVSPIAGVGMRASSDSQIVGTAQIKFDGSKGQSKAIKDTKGASHTVHIGYIPLQVGVAYYQAPGSNFLPPFVQRTANSVAGRPVSLVRLLASGILLLISFVGITVLLYISTKSAMISLGRNPLAAHDIRKSLYQTIAIAGVTAGVTLLAAYLILVV